MTLRRTFTTRSTKRTLTTFATRRSHGTHHGRRSVVPGLGSFSSHNPSPANHKTLAKIKFTKRRIHLDLHLIFWPRFVPVSCCSWLMWVAGCCLKLSQPSSEPTTSAARRERRLAPNTEQIQHYLPLRFELLRDRTLHSLFKCDSSWKNSPCSYALQLGFFNKISVQLLFKLESSTKHNSSSIKILHLDSFWSENGLKPRVELVGLIATTDSR